MFECLARSETLIRIYREDTVDEVLSKVGNTWPWLLGNREEIENCLNKIIQTCSNDSETFYVNFMQCGAKENSFLYIRALSERRVHIKPLLRACEY